MDEETQAEIEFIKDLDGIHVGLLDSEEEQIFNNLCEKGLAARYYDGPAGFFGLAKVKLKCLTSPSN